MSETPKDSESSETPGSPAPAGPTDARARLITRWIGTGIGAALLITVMSLVFARTCINSAQSHVMAVVLALGAAILLWGVVGGLKVDLKLKFKALGEVTAAGVAAIFLVVHFVSADGIISPVDCEATKEDPKDQTRVLYGRVFQHGAETKPVAQAEVKVELETIETRYTNDDGHFDIIIKGEVPRIRVWVNKPGFYESIPVDENVPLDKDKIRIPMVKLVPVDRPKPKIEDFPTFVKDWKDPLSKATKEAFDRAADEAKDDPLEAINWARRAHAMGEWDRTASFFDMAKAADPEGKTWFTDQGYLASAYQEMGRVEDATAVRSAVERAVEMGDPRIDQNWYRVTVQDFDLYSVRNLGDLGVGVYDPRVGGGVLPGVDSPRLPTPGTDSPRAPIPGVEPAPTVQPGVEPAPTVQPGVEPAPTVQPGVEPSPTAVEPAPTAPSVYDSPIRTTQPLELEKKSALEPSALEQPISPIGR